MEIVYILLAIGAGVSTQILFPRIAKRYLGSPIQTRKYSRNKVYRKKGTQKPAT